MPRNIGRGEYVGRELFGVVIFPFVLFIVTAIFVGLGFVESDLSWIFWVVAAISAISSIFTFVLSYYATFHMPLGSVSIAGVFFVLVGFALIVYHWLEYGAVFDPTDLIGCDWGGAVFVSLGISLVMVARKYVVLLKRRLAR